MESSLPSRYRTLRPPRRAWPALEGLALVTIVAHAGVQLTDCTPQRDLWRTIRALLPTLVDTNLAGVGALDQADERCLQND